MAQNTKLVTDYRKHYPSLAIDLLEFFDISNANRLQPAAGGASVQPRTVQEFLEHLHAKQPLTARSSYPQPEPINTICRKLVDLGWLSPAGETAGANFGGLNNTYMAALRESYDRRVINMQASNAIYGWPSIYDTYQSSIIPVLHEGPDSTLSIGTSFIVGPSTIVTAAHCILEAKTVAIRDVGRHMLQKASVYVSSNLATDLGIIQLQEPLFKDHFSIPLATGYVLDEVMVLGYPNVPGFHPTMAAEKALISSRFTAVRGAVTSTPEEIFARTSLFLITARVRGGFSGGPVLNSLGACVGVVSREPVSQSPGGPVGSYHTYDNLGYGTAIPSDLLKQLLEEVNLQVFTQSCRLQVDEITWTDFV